jgi:hypothetical protein
MSPSPPRPRTAALGLVLSGASAFALGLWWFLGAGSGSEADARTGAVDRAPSAAPELASVADDAEAQRSSADVFRAQPTVLEREAVCEDKALTFSGRLIVTDANGVEDREADGVLELVGWTPRRSERLRAPVKDGAWTAEFFNGEELVDFSVGAVELGERAVSIDAPEGRFFANAEREIAVRVRAWPRTTLRVLDDETGLDLDNLLLLRSRSVRSLGIAEPSWNDPARRVAGGLSSPIDLGALRARIEELGGGSFMICAPGFMWSTTTIDFERPSVRTLRLAPGGDLAIRVLGLSSVATAEVVVRRNGEYVSSYRISSGEPLEVLGLAPHTYDLAVVEGVGAVGALAAPSDAARATVEVLRGERVAAELTVGATEQ